MKLSLITHSCIYRNEIILITQEINVDGMNDNKQKAFHSLFICINQCLSILKRFIHKNYYQLDENI